MQAMHGALLQTRDAPGDCQSDALQRPEDVALSSPRRIEALPRKVIIPSIKRLVYILSGPPDKSRGEGFKIYP